MSPSHLYSGGRMTRYLTVAATKGGTGKTTTTWNLGCGLSMAGARVLLVDCDPQDNLQFIAGTDRHRGTVAAVLEGHDLEPAQIRENLWLLPSGGRRLLLNSTAADSVRSIATPIRRQLVSRDGSAQYDFTLFDCPPEFGRMTSAALSLSNFLLVPCVSTWLGLRSIEQMINFIDGHSRDARIEGEQAGIVMTFYTTRRAGPEQVRLEAKKLFKGRLLRTVIRERTELDYSQEAHKSVFEYAPSSDGAADYSSLVKEIIRRLG